MRGHRKGSRGWQKAGGPAAVEASALRLRQVHLRHRGKAREEEPVSPETWGRRVFGSKVGATEGAGQRVG